MTKKIVVNACFGEFNLSDLALRELGLEYACDIERSDPALIEVVERFGAEANGICSALDVIEIDDDYDYVIDDYDGYESVKYLPKRETVERLFLLGDKEKLISYLEGAKCFSHPSEDEE